MTANLVEKRGTWQYIILYYDASGKRRQKWVDTGLGVRGNKKKAESMKSEILAVWEPRLGASILSEPNHAHIENGPASAASCKKTLFADYMMDWLESVKNGLQVTTYAEYLRMAKKTIYPYFEGTGIFLEDIRPSDIQCFYNYLLKTLSPNSVLRYHANIRKALQAAVEDENIDIIINPADRVKKPQKAKYVSDIYSKEDLTRLFRVIGKDTLFLAILLDATYGLRRSELTGLMWDAISFDRKTITIKSSAVYCKVGDKRFTVVKPVLKTKSSFRTFPLTPEVEAALLAEKQRQALNRKMYGSNYSKEYLNHVLVDDLGSLRSPNYISKHFQLILRKHKLKKIRFHDLRHA